MSDMSDSGDELQITARERPPRVIPLTRDLRPASFAPDSRYMATTEQGREDIEAGRTRANMPRMETLLQDEDALARLRSGAAPKPVTRASTAGQRDSGDQGESAAVNEVPNSASTDASSEDRSLHEDSDEDLDESSDGDSDEDFSSEDAAAVLALGSLAAVSGRGGRATALNARGRATAGNGRGRTAAGNGRGRAPAQNGRGRGAAQNARGRGRRGGHATTTALRVRNSNIQRGSGRGRRGTRAAGASIAASLGDTDGEEESHSDGRLGPAFRRRLARWYERSRRNNSRKTTNTHLVAFDWFCRHDRNGNPRERPFSDDLSADGGFDVAVRAIEWMGDHQPGREYRKKKPNLGISKFKGFATALQNKLKSQQLERHGSEGTKLLQNPAFKRVYETIRNELAEKGVRPKTGRDAQQGTAQETLNQEQYYQLACHLYSLGSETALRDRSMCLFLGTCLGRGDDARLIYLADLMPPVQQLAIGPCPAFLLSMLLRGGKTQENGKPSYAGSIRHAVPELCPQAALGHHLFGMYTLNNIEFPDARDEDVWGATPMWPGSNPNENITYEAQCKAINKYLREDLGIYVLKSTHIFRIFGARNLDERGVDNSVILRMGGWTQSALHQSYLLRYNPKGLLSAAGWPCPGDDFMQYHHPRFYMEVPEKLIYYVYPFLRSLEQQVSSIDQPPPSIQSVVAALRYLATVVVQDALELVEKYPEHPLHKHLAHFDEFVVLHQEYLGRKHSGYFEARKPRTQAEATRETMAMLHQLKISIDELKNDIEALRPHWANEGSPPPARHGSQNAGNASEEPARQPLTGQASSRHVQSPPAGPPRQSSRFVFSPRSTAAAAQMISPDGAMRPFQSHVSAFHHANQSIFHHPGLVNTAYQITPMGILPVADPRMYQQFQRQYGPSAQQAAMPSLSPAQGGPTPAMPSAPPSNLPGMNVHQQPDRSAPSNGEVSSVIREVPKLGSMASLASFWRAWKVGDPVRGMQPLELLKDPANRTKGFIKQRFFELSKVANEIIRLANDKKVSEEDMSRTLDTKRGTLTVHQFVKDLIREKSASLLD